MKGKKAQKEDDRTKLILHFNVEKTIQIRTPKEYHNVEFLLKSIICSQIWGVEEVKDEEKIFKKTHTELEFDKTNIPDNENLINYLDFLNKKYSLRSVKDSETFEVDQAYNEEQMTKKVKAIIENRDKASPAFTFNKQLEDMKKKLRVDEKVTHELGLKIENKPIDYQLLIDKADDIKFDFNSENAIQNNFRALFKNAYHSTIISFFNLIITLTKNKRRFVVIFHFFDMNIEQIEEFIFEFNCFCEGKHPKFNGQNGTQAQFFDGENNKNFKDFRIKDYDSYSKSAENIGIFIRNTKNIDRENLIWESIIFPEQDIDDDLRDNIEEFLEGEEDGNNKVNNDLTQKVAKGYSKILTTMYEKLTDFSSLGFVDDSSLYLKSGKNGKLIIVDPYDYETQHIVFDSELDKYPNKVDIVDIATGKKLDNFHCLNKFLVNVDPRKAITDLNYFVNKIEFCENNRRNELQALRLKEFPLVNKPFDFDIEKEIKKISCDTYLEMTIFSLLQRVSELSIKIN